MSDEEKKGIELDVGGMKVNFRSAWLAIIVPVVGTAGGALWGGFELYSQFVDMKEATANYVSPDLSSYDERLSVLLERMESVERLTQTNKETLDYISGNLQASVSNAVKTADAVDARTRGSDRDVQQTLKDMQDQIRQFDKETQSRLKELEASINSKLSDLQSSVDKQIQETLANPLSGREE
jgi:CHASE3 domain sensor protein